MRIHIVIDETTFFLPDFLEGVISGLDQRDEIVGVSVLHNPPSVPSLYTHVKSNLLSIAPASIFRLGLNYAGQLATNCLFDIGLTKQAYNIRRIAEKHGLRNRVTEKLMAAESVDWIRAGEPDVVLSSCSQIFKKALLELPRIACINRHAALLPSYGGLFPIFQAIIHGEQAVGSTVHMMTPKIDRGNLISQGSTPINASMSLYSIYQQSYHDCIALVLEAFDKIRDCSGPDEVATKDFGVRNDRTPSYFSFPTKDDWQAFRNSGYRFC